MKNKEMSEKDKKILQDRLKSRRLFLDMTYQDLANKTGLSKSTLQRYETGGIKNLPYDKIFMLSEALEVSPSYFTDLSKDYTGEVQNTDIVSNREKFVNRGKLFEAKAMDQIAPKLICDGYKVERCPRGSIGDIIAIKGKEIWHIDFVYTSDINRYPVGLGMSRQHLLLRFGRLAVYDKPITKYSIVVERRVIAEQIIQQMNPLHLNIEVSILILSKDGYEELLFNN